jgi:hypothetical protein
MSFCLWSLYCLSFNSMLRITPLVSSTLSLYEWWQFMEGRKMSCLQSNVFLNQILYFSITGFHSDNGVSINSATNWNKSQSNCKTSNSKENNATDICELNTDTTVKTGIWTNIFRVEISSHIDQSNVFYNNIFIYPGIIVFAMQIYYSNKCLIRLVYE